MPARMWRDIRSLLFCFLKNRMDIRKPARILQPHPYHVAVMWPESDMSRFVPDYAALNADVDA